MWIKVAGKERPDLEQELKQGVARAVAAGKYSMDDAAYIAKMSLALAHGNLEVPDAVLEKLRSLCQLWDVDIRIGEIKSHRRFLGPLIVSLKRFFYPVLRVFLRDFIRQQRRFNAGVIALLAEIANRHGKGGFHANP